MPWQRFVSDVSLEVDPYTGLLAYRNVVLLIPRQSGKTTEGLAVRVHRALGFGGPQHLVYTAQTRNDARAKWEDEHTPILEASPFASLVRARKRTGAEAFVWANGSIDGLPAPTAKAGHGKTLDFGFIDEAFAQTDDRLEQAFRPAMITRPQPQLWVVSTAGTEASTYLRQKVLAGRRRVKSGQTSQTAYFEWSAPDEADPEDPVTWRACMPALGHTITEAAIRAELDSMLEEHGSDGLGLFRRAYLNQWVEAPKDQPPISTAEWASLADPASQIVGPVVFGLDASPDQSRAAIGVAGARRDGILHAEDIEPEPPLGTAWVMPRVLELQRRWKPRAWLLDPASPAGAWIPDLQEAGIEPVLVTGREMAQACGALKELVTERAGLRHLGQTSLRDALAGAKPRPLSDAWAWNRRNPRTNITPLVAITLAVYGFVRFGQPEPTSAYDADDLLIV